MVRFVEFRTRFIYIGWQKILKAEILHRFLLKTGKEKAAQLTIVINELVISTMINTGYWILDNEFDSLSSIWHPVSSIIKPVRRQN